MFDNSVTIDLYDMMYLNFNLKMDFVGKGFKYFCEKVIIWKALSKK